MIYLIRRNSEEAVELAKIDMPSDLTPLFLDSVGHNKGVWAVEGGVRDWLKKQIKAT